MRMQFLTFYGQLPECHLAECQLTECATGNHDNTNLLGYPPYSLDMEPSD